MDLVCIAIGASFAEVLTHPIDFIKTQKQFLPYKITSYNLFKTTYINKGIFGFYPSIYPAIARHLVYSTSRISLYQIFRKDESNFYNKLLSGLAAGGISQAIASPTDLIKVKIQTQSLSTNKHPNIIKIVKSTYKTSGLSGFYNGWKPNVIRAMMVNMGELAAYDYGKRILLNHMDDNIYCHTISSINSGFWSTLISTPADVIKTKIMGGNGNSISHEIKILIKNEGLTALWKGFSHNWIRLAPWQITFWVTYEQARRLAGLNYFS